MERASSTSSAVESSIVRRSFSKQIRIGRAPRALTLHVNRLIGAVKLQTRLHFGETIDIAPFTSRADGDDAPSLYSLRSIIVHHGGPTSGHFTVFRKHYKYRADDGARTGDDEFVWAHISDDVVTQVDFENVRSQAAAPYILCYQRNDARN